MSASTTRPLEGTIDIDQMPPLFEEGAGDLHRARHRVPHLEGPAIELDLAARDARHVEQVVDESSEMPDLAFDHGHLARLDLPQANQLHRRRDRRQRITQFVTEHRQELVLDAVGFGQVALAVAQGIFRALTIGDIAGAAGNGYHLPSCGENRNENVVVDPSALRPGERHFTANRTLSVAMTSSISLSCIAACHGS